MDSSSDVSFDENYHKLIRFFFNDDVKAEAYENEANTSVSSEVGTEDANGEEKLGEKLLGAVETPSNISHCPRRVTAAREKAVRAYCRTHLKRCPSGKGFIAGENMSRARLLKLALNVKPRPTYVTAKGELRPVTWTANSVPLKSVFDGLALTGDEVYFVDFPTELFEIKPEPESPRQAEIEVEIPIPPATEEKLPEKIEAVRELDVITIQVGDVNNDEARRFTYWIGQEKKVLGMSATLVYKSKPITGDGNLNVYFFPRSWSGSNIASMLFDTLARLDIVPSHIVLRFVDATWTRNPTVAGGIIYLLVNVPHILSVTVEYLLPGQAPYNLMDLLMDEFTNSIDKDAFRTQRQARDFVKKFHSVKRVEELPNTWDFSSLNYLVPESYIKEGKVYEFRKSDKGVEMRMKNWSHDLSKIPYLNLSDFGVNAESILLYEAGHQLPLPEPEHLAGAEVLMSSLRLPPGLGNDQLLELAQNPIFTSARLIPPLHTVLLTISAKQPGVLPTRWLPYPTWDPEVVRINRLFEEHEANSSRYVSQTSPVGDVYPSYMIWLQSLLDTPPPTAKSQISSIKTQTDPEPNSTPKIGASSSQADNDYVPDLKRVKTEMSNSSSMAAVELWLKDSPNVPPSPAKPNL